MKKLTNNSGVTLIEILIGIVISVIIMAAMFASYSAINNSYTQVTDKAKASQSGRNIMGMIMRDVRQAGFKYFEDNITNADEPIRISLGRGDANAGVASDCDHISIVYGDVSYDAGGDEVYERYRITYFCKDSEITDPEGILIPTNAMFKQKEQWDGGAWVTNTEGSYTEQLITDYVEDLIFIPKDIDGVAINPPPTNVNVNNMRIFDIRAVEIAMITRSVKNFYNNVNRADGAPRTIVDIESNTEEVINDLFLRETFVMSVNTRNIGLE